jgi:hypothetical protein
MTHKNNYTKQQNGERTSKSYHTLDGIPIEGFAGMVAIQISREKHTRENNIIRRSQRPEINPPNPEAGKYTSERHT